MLFYPSIQTNLLLVFLGGYTLGSLAVCGTYGVFAKWFCSGNQINLYMKKLIAFHLITLLPMFVIVGLYSYKLLPSSWFIILFMIYAIIYRPIFDYNKLKSKGLVTKNQFIKSLGFIRFKYYHELMFE